MLFIVADVRLQTDLTEAPPATRPVTDLAGGFTPGRFALLLGLLIFAAFPQILLGLQTFAVRDFGFFSYPVAFYQRGCFWRGEVPLWNPYNYCGVPFLAQWNTMALYPPALIYLLLPLTWSLSFFCLLHLFWAGMGMYFLARRWTGNLLAAAIAGLIFAFNGFTLNLLMWPSHIATFSWMPWVVAATEQGWTNGGRYLALAALVGALQMLGGAPETIFFTWSICAVFWMTHVVKERAWSCAWRFPAIVVLVAGIAAAQLLPFLDLASHSQRESGFADARWSMPASGWANFFVPMVFGSTVKQGLFFQHGQYWTSSYYVGIGTLVLAGIGVWARFGMLRGGDSRSGGRVWLLAGGALLGLVLAMGDQTFLSRGARHLLPQLSFMTYPVKYVMLAVFALPLLAAFGCTWLQENAGTAARRRLMISVVVVALILAGVLVWAWRFPQAGDNTQAALRNGLSRAVFLASATCLLWALVASGRLKLRAVQFAPKLLPALLLILFWFDLWTHEPQQNPGMPPWPYQEGLARTKLALKPEPALGGTRVMPLPQVEAQFRKLVLDDVKDNFLVKRLGFFADCNLLDGVPKVEGFFSLAPRECGELYSAVYVSGASYGSGLPDFLSVSHVTTPGEAGKWTPRDTFMPLATGGQSPVFLDDTNALLTLLSREFDPRQKVLLPLEAKQLVPDIRAQPVQVTVKPGKVTAHRIDLEAEAAVPALVVIGQTYYHQWRAYVDGKQTALLRANYAFQAVPVPGGKHHVELRYEDRPFRLGVLLSALSAAGCLGILLYSAASPQRPPRDSVTLTAT